MKKKNGFQAGSSKLSAASLLIILLSLTLVACGGGSSSDNNSSDNDTSSEGDNTDSDIDSDPGTDADSNTDSDSGGNSDSETDTDSDGDNTTTDGNNSDPDTGPDSGPDSNVSGGDIAFVGSVSIDQTGQSASASFFRTTQSISGTEIQVNFFPNADSCVVTETNFDVENPILPGFENLNLDPVGAGDVITLTSPAGTFAELVEEQQNGFIFYQPAGDGSLPGPVPEGTVIDIPGDEFPAFSNVGIPNATTLSDVTLSTGNFLTPDSTLSWTAASGSSSVMNLSASASSLPDFTDPNFDPTTFNPADLAITSVSCTIVDDGSFSFPSSIRSQLGGGFSANAYNFSRDGYSFEQSGNAFLTISVSSGN